jgi:hypothetical protein
MRLCSLFIFITFFSITFTSCDIINPEEEIPGYIYIDTIRLVANNTNEEHDLTHNFTDAWVFVDGNNIGAYELPATIPIIKNGTQELKVAPGIKINGVGGFRVDYPFTDFYINDSSFNIVQEEIVTITPIVEYYPSTEFMWIEDFENSTITIDTTSRSEAGIILNSIEARSGNYAGEITLTDTLNFFEAYSSLAYLLPKGGNSIYLEIDYNIEETLFIGLRAFHSDGSFQETTLVGIQPKTDDLGNTIRVWNKVYIELTAEVNAFYNTTAQAYQIAFSANMPSSNTSAKLLIDNIKLIHN